MSHQHNFESRVSSGSLHFGKHFKNLKLKAKQTETISKNNFNNRSVDFMLGFQLA